LQENRVPCRKIEQLTQTIALVLGPPPHATVRGNRSVKRFHSTGEDASFRDSGIKKGRGRMSRIEDGCLCGTVRYECSAEPLMTAVCHCTHCQKTSGSPLSINIGVPADSVAISGASLARFKDTGASGKPAWRSFCRTCGSSLAPEA